MADPKAPAAQEQPKVNPKLDELAGALANLRGQVENRESLEQFQAQLKAAFIKDLIQIKITDPAEQERLWQSAWGKLLATPDVKALMENREVEAGKKPLDEFIGNIENLDTIPKAIESAGGEGGIGGFLQTFAKKWDESSLGKIVSSAFMISLITDYLKAEIAQVDKAGADAGVAGRMKKEKYSQFLVAIEKIFPPGVKPGNAPAAPETAPKAFGAPEAAALLAQKQVPFERLTPENWATHVRDRHADSADAAKQVLEKLVITEPGKEGMLYAVNGALQTRENLKGGKFTFMLEDLGLLTDAQKGAVLLKTLQGNSESYVLAADIAPNDFRRFLRALDKNQDLDEFKIGVS